MPPGCCFKRLIDLLKCARGSVVFLALATFSARAEQFPNPWGTASPDGSHPNGGLVVSRGVLYGTTAGGAGGFWGYGTVFALKTHGKGFRVLHHFSTFSGPRVVTNSVGEISYPTHTNSDGAYPAAGLALSGRTLYGAATEGGSAGMGTVFKVNTDGSGFAVLHHFSGTSPERPFGNSDGARPMARLVIAGNTLYGTAQRGGYNQGTIFKLNTDGSGFVTLHMFSPLNQSPHHLTNCDGAFPESSLIVSRSTIYGTAWSGGVRGNGTIFKLGTDGSEFQVLHEFGRGTFDANGRIGDEDGSTVEAGLVPLGKVLFGTTHEGGAGANGVVFKINTNGSGFSVLHSFSPHAPRPLTSQTTTEQILANLFCLAVRFWASQPMAATMRPARFSGSPEMAPPSLSSTTSTAASATVPSGPWLPRATTFTEHCITEESSTAEASSK